MNLLSDNLPFISTTSINWEGMFRGLRWVQDSAPAHRLIEVRDRLNEVFGENRHVIALHHDVEWPPRSPDLTLCVIFLCGGIVRTKCSPLHPRTSIDVLRQRIIDEFNVLRQQPEMIRNAVRHMHKRTILCVERNGGCVEAHGP